jgi:transposase-like protein
MSTVEVIETVRRLGGVLKLEGDNVKCWLPKAAAHLAGELKERKPEVVALLKTRGLRVAAFRHCPRCASYYLYRENNVGNYECVSCGR